MDQIPIESLLGFPEPVVLLAIVCYTIVKVVELIVNRKKDKIELAKKDSNPPTSDGS